MGNYQILVRSSV